MTARHGQDTPGKGRHAALICAELKRLFRAHGLRYRDVAQAIGASEATVKRWMASENFTIDQVETLAHVVGVSFAELTELATKDNDVRLRRLSRAQEEGLTEQHQVLFVFWLLLNGWSAAEIKRECAIEEHTLVTYLTKLDKLRLIDLLPGNNIRLLTKREIDWLKDGPVRGTFNRRIRQYFLEMDFTNPSSIWASTSHKLSSHSAGRLEKMCEEFKREVRMLAEADRNLHEANKSWYVTLMAARPVPIESLKGPMGQ
jgi:transcriptional regulator with XRE-family HTH domain